MSDEKLSLRSLGLRLVRWLFGDLPELERQPNSGPMVIGVSFAAALGMWLGLRHAFKVDPMVTGSWRMLAHGGPALAAVGLLELYFRRGREGAVLVVAGALLLVGPLFFRLTEAGEIAIAGDPVVWLVLPGLLGTVLVLTGMRRMGARREDWGIGLGDWRWWLPHHGVLLLCLLPVVALATWQVDSLHDYYPLYTPARTSFSALVTSHIALALDFVGWEFLFRGVLLFGIARRGDALLAIVLQAFPFFLLHYKKPELELLTSFGGGILAGWFCLRARSFFPLYVIHLVMISTVGITAFLLVHFGLI